MTHLTDSPAAPETGFSAEISCSPAECTSAGHCDLDEADARLARAEAEIAPLAELIEQTLAAATARLTPESRASWVHQWRSPLGREHHCRLFRRLRREGSPDVRAIGRSRMIRLSAILPHLPLLPQKANK